MTFEEFAKKDKEAIDKASKCKNIDEFKKFATENTIEFTEDELKQAWKYVQSHAQVKDGELNDDALDSVAGGKDDDYSQHHYNGPTTIHNH